MNLHQRRRKLAKYIRKHGDGILFRWMGDRFRRRVSELARFTKEKPEIWDAMITHRPKFFDDLPAREEFPLSSCSYNWNDLKLKEESNEKKLGPSDFVVRDISELMRRDVPIKRKE